jgi:hypothetical protein
VKTAWRAASRRSHPDVGGDPSVFKAVQKAWAALQPAGRAAVDRDESWNHARAVRHLVDVDGIDVSDGGDETCMAVDGPVMTAFAGPGGVIWLSDEDLECDGYPLSWGLVDDRIMTDVVDYLLAR